MSLKAWLTKNVYVTSPRDPDPFFRPRQYSCNRDEIIQLVQQSIGLLKGWKIEEHRENQGRVQASRRGFVGLGEVVNVYVVQGVDGVTSLEITSQSKVGKGDWGQNKRNVKALLTLLDAKIK